MLDTYSAWKEGIMHSRIIILALGLFTALSMGLSTRSVSASCSAPPDTACPVSAGPMTVFDRCFGSLNGQPTAVGNKVCDLARDLKKTIADLPEPLPLNNQVQQDLGRALQVVFADTVNADSIATFNHAGQIQEDIINDLQGYLQDPQCGVNGQLEFLQQYFNKRVGDFQNFGQDLAIIMDIAAQLGKAGQEGGEILAQLGQLASLVNESGSEARRQFTILQRAIGKLMDNAREVAGLDLSVIGDTATLAAQVGPWIGSCGTCAGLLIDAAKNVSIGGGSTAAGAGGCPETGAAAGGSCWVIIPGVTITGTGGVEAALSSIPCTAAGDGLNKLEDYEQKLEKLFDTINKLITSTQSSLNDIQTASDALVALARTLPAEAEGHINNIRQALNRAGDDLNSAADLTSQQLIPALATQSEDRLRELGDNVGHLLDCYAKAEDLAGEIGGRVLQGFDDMRQALTHLVNGQRVVTNIQAHGRQGLHAAEAYIRRKLADIQRQLESLNQEVFGVRLGVVDPGRTVPHLIALAGDSSRQHRIASQVSAVSAEIAVLPGDALNEGKKAFLADTTGESNCIYGSACGEFGLVGRSAHSALQAFQARQASRHTQAPAFRPPHVRLPTLHQVPTNLKHQQIGYLRLASIPATGIGHQDNGSGSGKTVPAGRQISHGPGGAAAPSLAGFWGWGGGPSGKPQDAARTRVASVTSHHLRVPAGGQPVSLQFKGTGLGHIDSILVLNGSRPSHDIRARVTQAADTSITVALQASSKARAGEKHSLRLVSGKTHLDVPARVVIIEVVRANRTTRKPLAGGTIMASGRGPTHLGQGNATMAMTVKSATPRTLRLQAGSGARNLSLHGSGLENLRSVHVLLNRRPVKDIRIKVNRKAKSSLTLSLAAMKTAHPARNYSLRLATRTQHYDIPVRIATIEVVGVRSSTRGSGHGPSLTHRGDAGMAMTVKSATPRTLRLQAGSGVRNLALHGSGLENLRSVHVLLNRRPVKDIRVKVNRKSKNGLTLSLVAMKTAHPARNYSLRLATGTKSYDIPTRIAAIEVVGGKTSKPVGLAHVSGGSHSSSSSADRAKPGKVTQTTVRKTSISSASTTHLRLAAGGKAVQVTLRGSELQTIHGAQVQEHGRLARGIKTRIVRKSGNSLTLSLVADSHAGTTRNLNLVLTGKGTLSVPTRVLAIETVAANPGNKGSSVGRKK